MLSTLRLPVVSVNSRCFRELTCFYDIAATLFGLPSTMARIRRASAAIRRAKAYNSTKKQRNRTLFTNCFFTFFMKLSSAKPSILRCFTKFYENPKRPELVEVFFVCALFFLVFLSPSKKRGFYSTLSCWRQWHGSPFFLGWFCFCVFSPFFSEYFL